MVAPIAPSRWVAATTACPKCGMKLRVERGTLKPEPCPVCGAVGFVGAVKAKVASEARSTTSKRCVLGHVHRGHGERTACPIVHATAANRGLTTFVPGSPGIACFCLAPNESGRPVYVSIDWVLVNAAHKIVLGLDWKGETTHSAMYGHGDGFARTKRIFETETGAKVVELKTLDDIGAALALTVGES